ncbi:hypothetical protein BSKO_10372 [Bryopsis sp. KO-2023]|nr:hypothetical protein BSKO_10372 [Bryopsis sp. KO-2023]
MDLAFSGKDELTKDHDLTIVCKDGVKLHVHSLIMSKWSEVFGALPAVRDKVMESVRTSEITVEEESAAWRELLGLIYPVSPLTILEWESVGRIFDLADKYNMPGVLERCEAFLMSTRNGLSSYEQDNNYALKWLAFAAKYNQRKLHEKCMQYIRLSYRSIDELRCPREGGVLKSELAAMPSGVDCIVEILSFVMQQRR